MKLFYKKNLVAVCLLIMTVLFTTGLKAQILFSESFNTAVPLPTGWAQQNLSSPIGTVPNWLQGVATVFPANSGATTAYIRANFNSVAGANIISNWLFTPSVTITNGDQFTFYTRTTTPGGTVFPDRLQVRLSTNGASTNVGSSNTSVGDFSTLLLDINPTYSTTVYPSVWTQYTITISGVPTPTAGRIAFRYFVEDGGPSGNNSDYIGIDDVVYTTFGSACTGTPDPGNTVSSAATVCPNINFILSLQNTVPGSGITYQWQSSPDGTAWTNITGATSSTLTTSQTAATYYRCNVTCSGNTGASAQVQVGMSAPTSCYCQPPASDCTDGDEILNVTAAGINNSSTCSGPSAYSNYTSTVAPGSVPAGLSMPMSVTVGNGGAESVGVWIDYNQNGVFEATEFTSLGSGNNTTINGTVIIPANALVGLTTMRVRVKFGAVFPAGNACTGYTYSETEDYALNITPCIPGTISTQPAASVTSYCSGNASISVTAVGTGLTYQWQERLNATSPWTIVANGGVYSGASTATLTLTDLTTNFNGRQYRVAIGGPCTPLFLSGNSTLTVGPLVATVNPASATICNGAIQPLSITTTAPPTTLSIPSGPLTLIIPDNNPAGSSNTITTNAVPAGAIVTGIKVRFSMAHTWPGDICAVLKAPNGSIINLNYFISATGAGPGTGYVNTTFSSQTSPVLPLIGTGSNPYTGTFRPDAVVIPAAGNPPSGPTGNLPTTNNFANLFSVPNGNWTLAFYDGFNGDEGTLSSWTLELTYGAPFSGIWSPAAGLFTDAAATVPYVDGTLANTVYASPAVSTDYSVSISTANCTGTPAIVPITVANSIGNVTAPTSQAICVNGNTSFTVSAGSGNPITYQWQVSTDAGATWSNITNGGVYSGATTAILNLTGVPGSYTNNQYRAVLTVTACSSTENSGAATLTVNPLPVIVINAAPYTKLYPGITTTITAAVSPNAAVTYQWYKNGIPVPGATNERIVVDVDNMGDYSVMVNDVNGCTNSSASLTISEAANDILFIYPSPNTGQFQVRYYNLNGNAVNPRTLSIYDSKGARVFSRTYNITLPYSRMDVDMSNYSKGIYRVELGDVNGKRIKTGSVVIL